MTSVTELYQQTLAERGYQADEAQLRAVASLQRCQDEWAAYKARRSNALTKLLSRPPIPRGVYMYGGVGRGKSFLMDCFFQAVPLTRKTRLHFHEFMREVHRELQELKGIADPLEELGKRIARRFRLICFDEFHVADVTDAMILHRLLDALFRNRVSIVTTSNFHPDELYPNGLHRDRILPAIALLKANLEVINVDAGTDYRQRTLEDMNLYLTPLNDANEAALTKAFESLAEAQDEDRKLMIEHRAILARRRAGGVVWFDFQTLCGGPRSQNDYLELASQFHTVILSDVPEMPVRLASEARRFTWLVDVLYDRRVKLIISAAVPAEAALHRWAARARVPAHGVALAGDAFRRIPRAGPPRGRYFADMSFYPLILLAAAASAASGAPQPATRAEVAAQRAAIEQRFAVEKAACEQRFSVSACMDEVRQRRHGALVPLVRREHELAEQERHERAAEQIRRVSEREQAAAQEGGQHRERLLAAPHVPAPAASPARRTPHPEEAARARQQAEKQAEAEAVRRRDQAQQRQQRMQARIAQREAHEKARTKPLAAPLPMPALPASSASKPN